MEVVIKDVLVGEDYPRISRDAQYLAICQIISFRGTCRRAHVGCVITQNNRIVSTGYNGGLQGSPCNCDKTKKCTQAVHAEQNAIAFAAREGISLNGAHLYCTYSPCRDCARLIVQSGILNVTFELEYKTDNGEGLDILLKNGVEVNKY